MWFVQAILSVILGVFFSFLIGAPSERLGALSVLLTAGIAPIPAGAIGYAVGSKWPAWRSTGKFSWILPFGLWTWAVVYDWSVLGWKSAIQYGQTRSFEFALFTVPMVAGCAYSLGMWLAGSKTL
jgi:hypothetical protein